jgi:imidazolonepropionase-like amidohydrolase
MLEHGTYLCPTLAVLENVAAKDDYYGGPESLFRRVVKENIGNSRSSVQLAHARGVPIIAGTDAGTPGMEFDSLHDELACLLRLGLSAQEAIMCATSVAADALGQSNLGRVAPGARADLLAVMGDPISDPGVLRSPRAVWIDGKLMLGALPLLERDLD